MTSVRRRRRELALLKTIGFGRRQVSATVAWQATTLAFVGLVVGIPIGLLLGRLVWQRVADGLGVETVSTVSAFGLVADHRRCARARQRHRVLPGALPRHARARRSRSDPSDAHSSDVNAGNTFDTFESRYSP